MKTPTFEIGNKPCQLGASEPVNTMKRVRGFTLVELLVVFAIIGLVVALVPIAFDRLRESVQYRDTLRTMMADMRAARYLAMAEGREIGFKLDLQHRSFGLDGKAMRELPAAIQLRVTVAAQELAPTGAGRILFLPDGGATGGSIDVVRSTGVGTRLRVDWLSGKVSQESLSP